MNQTKQITALTALICMISLASASSFGVSPPGVEFKNILKGGYGEDQFYVGTASDENMTVKIEVEGDMADWLQFTPGKIFMLPAKSQVPVKVMIKPPTDVPSGTYTTYLNVVGAPLGSGVEGSGVSMGLGVRVTIKATVTGEQRMSYRIEGISVEDTEIGYPIKFTASVLNNGNVRLKPSLSFEIIDKASGMTKKTSTFNNVEVLPTKTEQLKIEIPSSGLDVGKYDAKVKSEGMAEQVLTFNILEKGTLALTGQLRDLSTNKIWVEEGESAKIRGDFYNNGQLYIEKAKLIVEAYLIDENYKTEKLVKTMESDTLDVPVSSQADLTTYFTPEKPGRYILRGQVIYSGKKTPPKETIVNVLTKPTNYTPYYIAIAVLVILIIYYLTRRAEDGRTRRFKKIWGDYLKIK